MASWHLVVDPKGKGRVLAVHHVPFDEAVNELGHRHRHLIGISGLVGGLETGDDDALPDMPSFGDPSAPRESARTRPGKPLTILDIGDQPWQIRKEELLKLQKYELVEVVEPVEMRNGESLDDFRRRMDSRHLIVRDQEADRLRELVRFMGLMHSVPTWQQAEAEKERAKTRRPVEEDVREDLGLYENMSPQSGGFF